MLSENQLAQYHQEGYVLIEEAVPAALLEPLREAAQRTTERTRSGQWPHRRDAGSGDIWGVGHLLHPDLGEPTFAEYMACDVVIDVVAQLLGVEDAEAELELELVNMLVNPSERDYAINWHRDLVREDLEPAEELARLQALKFSVQWNTALYDESSLLIVPGSHLRAKTPRERAIAVDAPRSDMPDQLVVELKAGQGVYYDANLLHRGVYPHTTQRQTIHCCMGRIAGARQRTYIYDALPWMDDEAFGAQLPARLRPLHANFRAMAARYRAGDFRNDS